MADSTAAKKSESKVAAREQLEAQTNANSGTENLEERAKAQEKQQAELLNSKLSGPAVKAIDEANSEDKTAAHARALTDQSGTVGRIDNMSRRSGNDALEGHFVTIDLDNSEVKDAFKQAGLEGHQGDYGVFLQRALVDPDTGYPTHVVVRLRDETNARVTLPYDALRPAEARGR